MKSKEYSILVSVKMPERLVEAIDKIVKECGVRGRSELIRYAVEYCLERKCYEVYCVFKG
jgi:metal-responsive CopG/Arc/MetJ family transcriptional regulator